MVEVANQSPLIGARQEARAPELGPLKDRGGADHHEGRQVLVLRPQAVDEPRAEARPREGLLARVHLEGRPGVVDVVGDHRADHAEVVDVRRQVRQELAHLGPALAVFRELPRGGQQVARLDALEPRLLERERLAVHRGHLRLGIEQVDVRRPARHVEEDAALRGRGMVRGPDGVRVGRAVGYGNLACRRLARQQVRERHEAKAVTGSRQKIAPGWVRSLPHGNVPRRPDGSVHVHKLVTAEQKVGKARPVGLGPGPSGAEQKPPADLELFRAGGPSEQELVRPFDPGVVVAAEPRRQAVRPGAGLARTRTDG